MIPRSSCNERQVQTGTGPMSRGFPDRLRVDEPRNPLDKLDRSRFVQRISQLSVSTFPQSFGPSVPSPPNGPSNSPSSKPTYHPRMGAWTRASVRIFASTVPPAALVSGAPAAGGLLEANKDRIKKIRSRRRNENPTEISAVLHGGPHA